MKTLNVNVKLLRENRNAKTAKSEFGIFLYCIWLLPLIFKNQSYCKFSSRKIDTKRPNR